MIAGVGIDLVQICRIRAAVERFGSGFLNRVFCKDEIAFCSQRKDPYPCFAARFAAKEALVKAFGTGFSKGITMKQMCVRKDEKGAPKIILFGKAKEAAIGIGVNNIHLSLSHEREMAAAVVILEKSEEV